MYWWRETLTCAYLCGLYECTRYGNGMGRTHDTNADWNWYYDTGMNHADWLCRRKD
jgi:hypothetical protein